MVVMSIENSAEYQFSAHERNALEELEAPLEHILNERRQEIENGAYSLVVGVDASGRLPTRIVQKALHDIYTARKLRLPNVEFMAGGASLHPSFQDKMKILSERLSSLRKQQEKEGSAGKVLVVVDAIFTASELQFVAETLRESGWTNIDVAAIGIDWPSEDKIHRFERMSGTRISFGMPKTPKVLDPTGRKAAELSGVHKAVNEPYARVNRTRPNPKQFTWTGFRTRYPEFSDERIAASRAFAKKSGSFLARRFEEVSQRNRTET